jgi:hypothetical protein
MVPSRRFRDSSIRDHAIVYETENLSDELTVFIMADKSDDIIDPQSSEKLHPDLHTQTQFQYSI